MAVGGTSRNTLTDGGHHSYQQKSMTPGSGEGKPVEETWFCAVKSASFPRVFSFTNENVTLNSGCSHTSKELYGLKNKTMKKRSRFLSKNEGDSLMTMMRMRMMLMIIITIILLVPKLEHVAHYNAIR